MNNRGGYHVYFKATWAKDGPEYANQINKMKELLDQPNPIQFDVSTIIYNINSFYSFYYNQAFAVNNGGLLTFKKTYLGFTQQYYSRKAVGDQQYYLRLIFDGFYIFFQVLQVVFLVFVLLGAIKESIRIKRCTLAWYYYIDIIVVSLVSVSIYYLITIYLTSNETIPLSDESKYESLETYAYDITVYYYVSAVAICFMFIRSLRILNSIFPSFSVLFDTIRRSGSDLCFFLLMAFMLLMGFVLMAYISFGSKIQEFRNIGQSFTKLFVMLMGSIDYYQLELVNPSIAPIFFFGYMILFFFIILNMFLAIVMATYGFLQEQKGMDTLATTYMVKTDFIDYLKKLYNLLVCKAPKMMQKKQKETVVQPQEQEEDDADDDDQNKDDVQDQGKSEMKCKDIFLYNFTQACCRSGARVTVEQLEVRRKLVKEKIRREREQKKQEKREEENSPLLQYRLMCNGFLFILFIIVFGTATGLVLQTATSFHAINALNEEIESHQYGSLELQNAQSVTDMRTWIQGFTKQFESKSQVSQYSFFFSDPRFKLTLRLASLQNVPDDPSVKGVVSKIRSNNDFNAKKQNNADELKSHANLTYIASGTTDTAFMAGGFVTTLNSGVINDTTLSTFFNQANIGANFGSLTVQFVAYNPNMEYVVAASVIFEQTALGTVKPTLLLNYMQTDTYKGGRLFRVFFQILYIAFVGYFLGIEFIGWLTKEAEIREKAWKENHSQDQEFVQRKRCERYIRYLGFNFEVFVEDSAIVKAIKMIIGHIILIFRWVFYFIKVTYVYILSDFFKLLNIASLSLSVASVAQWIIIVNYYYSMSSSPDYIGEFTRLGRLTQTFKLLVAINALLIFLRLLQYFKFNKRLSVLSDVISSAATDAGFFLLMFAIVLLGFAIWGNTVFGVQQESMSSVFKAIHSFFVIITGDFDYENLESTGHVTLVPLFFVTFMVLFNLLLLNMFIAIVSAHYEEIYNMVKEDEAKQEKKASGMCKRIALLIRFRCSKKYNKMLKEDRKEQLRLFIFCIRCCGKGNEGSKKKDAPNHGQSTCCCCKKRNGGIRRAPTRVNTKRSSGFELQVAKNDIKEEQAQNGNEEDKEQEAVALKNLINLFTRQKPQLDDREMIRLRDVVDLQEPSQKPKKKGAVTDYDMGSQVFWLRTLERALRRVSNNKLKLNEFAMREEPPSLNIRFHHQFSNLQMAYLNTEDHTLLEEASDKELYSMFRALRFMDLNQTPSLRYAQLSLKFLKKWEETESNPNIDRYRRFWDQLSSEVHKELWLNHFTSQDRVALWNSVCFSLSYFYEHAFLYQAVTDKEFNVEIAVKDRIWRCIFESEVDSNERLMKIKDLSQGYLKYLIQGHKEKKKKIIEIELLPKIYKIKARQDRYDLIMRFLNDGEQRIQLWFALSLDQKVELIKQQRDMAEAKWMMLLLIEEYKQKDYELKQIDIQLETILDNSIYNKFSLLSQWQAISASAGEVSKRIAIVNDQDKGLIEYLQMIEDKNIKLQNQKKMLQREHDNVLRSIQILIEEVKRKL